MVGNDYKVIQNVDSFKAFDNILGGDGMLYETAGALGNGEQIFITAKLPSYMRVGKDDIIENYLFITSRHDGKASVRVAFTPIRIVCQNTLNAALSGAVNSKKIRHTENAGLQLDSIGDLLGITNSLSNELEEVFNHWSKVRISDSEVKKLIQMAMAPSIEVYQKVIKGENEELSTKFINKVESVLEYAFSSPTQLEATTKGTVFGAYNAITGYFQNVKNFNNEETKLKSVMFGTGLKQTQAGFNLCNSFALEGKSALLMN